MGHMSHTTLKLRDHQYVNSMIDVYTNFEVQIFTRYGKMKDNAKYV